MGLSRHRTGDIMAEPPIEELNRCTGGNGHSTAHYMAFGGIERKRTNGDSAICAGLVWFWFGLVRLAGWLARMLGRLVIRNEQAVAVAVAVAVVLCLPMSCCKYSYLADYYYYFPSNN